MSGGQSKTISHTEVDGGLVVPTQRLIVARRGLDSRALPFV